MLIFNVSIHKDTLYVHPIQVPQPSSGSMCSPLRISDIKEIRLDDVVLEKKDYHLYATPYVSGGALYVHPYEHLGDAIGVSYE